MQAGEGPGRSSSSFRDEPSAAPSDTRGMGSGSSSKPRPSVNTAAINEQMRDRDEDSPARFARLAGRVAEGEAEEESLDEAADLLCLSVPRSMDPYGFAIPEPAAWREAAEGSTRDRPTARGLQGAEELRSIRGGRGVPLRLMAGHPEVAWEFDGKLQPLIGAAKRTGDPNDVW
eukprot:TRINITY_DN110724_c0_g1_i1.p2 TRINITY_DN110724_c0_g1~~TRINITY_DN110724_c0_g1_i1.p2  ORF type:complete len:174 (+),score=18.67 TRINITY_DN110724_c0_g1_i1:78-599(+)